MVREIRRYDGNYRHKGTTCRCRFFHLGLKIILPGEGPSAVTPCYGLSNSRDFEILRRVPRFTTSYELRALVVTTATSKKVLT